MFTKEEIEEWMENIQKDKDHEKRINKLIDKDNIKKRKRLNYMKECIIQNKLIDKLNDDLILFSD